MELENNVTLESTAEFKKKLIERIELALSNYNFVKKEKVAFLANGLANDMLSIKEDVLSLDEKKLLKLNTRAKYPRVLIECFDNIESLNFDPKVFCENVLYTERSIVWSFENIENFKSKEFIKNVFLEGKGNWNNKTYNINEIPSIEPVDYRSERVLFFANSKIDVDDILNLKR